MKRISFPLKMYSLLTLFMLYAVFVVYHAIVNLSEKARVSAKTGKQELPGIYSLQSLWYKNDWILYNMDGNK